MRKRLGAVLLVLGLGLAVAGPATAASAVPPFDGLEYVALGDSYSAGFGVGPYVVNTTSGVPLNGTPDVGNFPANGCYQSTENYPKQIADALGLSLGANNINDRTCSGAVTANIRDTPQLTMNGHLAPVQSDWLSATTDVVTLTIGGNDLTFADVARFCVRLGIDAESFPIGDFLIDNCKEWYWPIPSDPDTDKLINLLDDTVKPSLAETFALIKEKAPNAKVFVIGYPSIAPDLSNIPTPQPPGCFTDPVITNPFGYRENSFPYSQVDTLYLHHVEDAMDNASQAAAEAAGFTFIPTWAATQAHSACATGAPGSATEPYIFGVTLTGSNQNSIPTPDPVLFIELGALHPNPAGVDFIAAQVIDAMRTHPAFGAEATSKPQLAATGAAAFPLVAAGLLLALAGGVLAFGRKRSAV